MTLMLHSWRKFTHTSYYIGLKLWLISEIGYFIEHAMKLIYVVRYFFRSLYTTAINFL